jgi:hypothetical protein
MKNIFLACSVELVDVVADHEKHLLGLLRQLDAGRKRAFSDDQIGPLRVDAVPNVHALIFPPFPHLPDLVFLESTAVLFVHEKEKSFVIRVLLVLERGHAQGVITAGGRPVFVKNAAFSVANERTGFAIIVHQLHRDHRQAGFLQQAGLCVDGQKILGA